MVRNMLLRFLLAAQITCCGLFAVGDTLAPCLLGLDIQSKYKSDAILVQAATGLVVGEPLSDSEFQQALSAVKLTDRFRKVEGTLVSKANGVTASIQVESWPIIEGITWRGDLHSSNIKKHISGLRVGMRPGDLRLAAWSQELQMKLVEIGYPDAKVSWIRQQSDKRLIITVKTSVGMLLRRINVVGKIAPYTVDEIKKFTRLVPERTLWTPITQQEALKNLYRVMQFHKRYEARIDFKWERSGTLNININTGPKVILILKGDGSDWFDKIKRLIPLSSFDSYTPALLDEGDRRIIHYLQSRGYLDAQVWHRREITRVKNDHDDGIISYVYTICLGRRFYLNKIRFNGNVVFGDTVLQRVVHTSRKFFSLKGQCVSPDFLEELEAKIKLFYVSRGYMDVVLKSQLENKNGKKEIVFKIKEGTQHLIHWLKLEVPLIGSIDPWIFGKCLALSISKKPKGISGLGSTCLYYSDRQHQKDIYGSLTIDNTANGVVVVTFVFSKPIALVRSDLARVINAIEQQHISSVGGISGPLMNVKLELIDGVGIYIKTPIRPFVNTRRLVVTGLGRTSPKVIFRNAKPQSHLSLDSNDLKRMQIRLNNSSAFQRVDIHNLLDQEHVDVANKVEDTYIPMPWKVGDLQITVEEGPPYVIASSFSYDKDQGYRLGLWLTQLNVGGMGREIDYGIRIGNGFIKSPKLSRVFPTGATGTADRSIDSLTVGYTDPWFASGLWKRFLSDRTNYRVEVAYIREQSRESLCRRRISNSLQWVIDQELIFKLGHRWEHVNSIRQPSYLSCNESNSKFVISAPFVQIDRDTRDSPLDPTCGMHSVVRLEFANQPFFSHTTDSFVKLDLKNQKIWSFGDNGLVSLGLRLAAVKTTSGQTSIPRSERLFAGGPFSFRGTGPDALGPEVGHLSTDCTDGDTVCRSNLPTGGRGLILINAEYQFPFFSRFIWGELFIDSGQVYKRLSHHYDMPRSSFRTALGFGFIFKLGVPIKIEYATELNRILGKNKNYGRNHRCQFLISAGSQF